MGSGKKRKAKEEDSDKGKKKKGKAGATKDKDSSSQPLATSMLAPGIPQEVLDMPVDPNEPTYCLCQQVSYGEMIGCDNVDCPIEWFHFGCMQLTNKPRASGIAQNVFLYLKRRNETMCLILADQF